MYQTDLGYAGRLKTLAIASSRFAAYTSDVGEAVRPLVHPGIVSAAYAVSFLYVGGDVAWEGYKARREGPSAFEAHNFGEGTR